VSTVDIHDYLDYRKFLRDWFDAHKKENPRFSHRAFVRRTGQRSPSLLADVIKGRRNLTPQAAASFVRAMRLNAEEGAFFKALVALDQGETHQEKNDAWSHISSSRKLSQVRRIEGEAFRCLSHWYYPAIRELAALESFVEDPQWIAERLAPPITPHQAAQALKSLLEVGMLVREGGRLKPSEGLARTPHEVVGLAVHNYHDGMLDLARRAIHDVPARRRHFTAVTTSIPRSKVAELKQELAAFQERLLALCDAGEDPDEEVIQINLHFFPLTGEPE